MAQIIAANQVVHAGGHNEPRVLIYRIYTRWRAFPTSIWVRDTCYLLSLSVIVYGTFFGIEQTLVTCFVICIARPKPEGHHHEGIVCLKHWRFCLFESCTQPDSNEYARRRSFG